MKNEPRELAPGEIELLEANLRDAIRVEPLALEEEFVRTPGDLAYWTARHAVSIGVHLRAKARAKKLRALLFLEAREVPEAPPEAEAPTANDVAAATGADPETAKAVAEAGKKAKAAAKPKAPPRATEKDADSRVELDPRWQDAQEAEIAAEVEREKMKGAVAALVAKKDMLVQLGANQRAELERDPVIRERHFADRLGRR
jgi:hypothetical protein